MPSSPHLHSHFTSYTDTRREISHGGSRTTRYHDPQEAAKPVNVQKRAVTFRNYGTSNTPKTRGCRGDGAQDDGAKSGRRRRFRLLSAGHRLDGRGIEKSKGERFKAGCRKTAKARLGVICCKCMLQNIAGNWGSRWGPR